MPDAQTTFFVLRSSVVWLRAYRCGWMDGDVAAGECHGVVVSCCHEWLVLTWQPVCVVVV